ncbi:hypothetical protein pb186bvf_006037 [Paramecium bursaria]
MIIIFSIRILFQLPNYRLSACISITFEKSLQFQNILKYLIQKDLKSYTILKTIILKIVNSAKRQSKGYQYSLLDPQKQKWNDMLQQDYDNLMIFVEQSF